MVSMAGAEKMKARGIFAAGKVEVPVAKAATSERPSGILRIANTIMKVSTHESSRTRPVAWRTKTDAIGLPLSIVFAIRPPKLWLKKQNIARDTGTINAV